MGRGERENVVSKLLGAPPPAWFSLKNSHEGLFVRNTARSYTTPLVAQYLIYAGVYAWNLKGRLAIADISGPEPGPFTPHLSHQEGRDADVSYTLQGKYPTPVTTPMSPDWIAVMHAISPWLEVIFMSQARIEEYAKTRSKAPLGPIRPLELLFWAGHAEHAHLRFRTGQQNLVPGPQLPP